MCPLHALVGADAKIGLVSTYRTMKPTIGMFNLLRDSSPRPETALLSLETEILGLGHLVLE